MKRAVIEAENLAFAYAANSILEISRLRVNAGSHTLICGDSGCGKSTLMNLISGVLSGSTGNLRVLGQDLSALSPAKRDRFRAQHIAVIFQQFNLIPYLTVTENILLALRVAGQKKDHARIAAILDHLQIAHVARQRASELSHGQQQRAAAARALALNAELILADEPTSALDDTNAKLFLELLFGEAETNSRTIVVVSHDLRYRKRFDQVIDLAEVNRAVQKSRPRARKSA
ncbi:MAG TPA: ATP-binding cassette domain-containing protein [Turneriella sp.]|nr:ATP-binding cassette domain-containing protein [Turneriella sp.]HNJ65793.1 ATP-binding cassette domain-containing protein [Turneriella sp.]HNL11071.1 ATP-binding cassette domain-containing protein [Turneriella sp.]HNL54021.1 ATP-binding cassette domain-containing protein [Turneriella sp.]HNM99452.1 ATP-binding cassette domain-containing protein [Turneriella sp.]